MSSSSTPFGDWFYLKDEKKIGPLTVEELREKLNQGELSPHSSIRNFRHPQKEVALNDLLHILADPNYSLMDALQAARDKKAIQKAVDSPPSLISSEPKRSKNLYFIVAGLIAGTAGLLWITL